MVESLLGVTLHQFCGIEAALSEGFPLADVLANESIAPAVWAKAQRAWASKVGREGPGSALDKAFRDKLAEARAWLGRRIDPLDRDPVAYCAFQKALAAHEAPAELLRAAGMRREDVPALAGLWRDRCATDAELRRRMEDLLAKESPAVPSIRVQAAVLRPYPWSRPRSRAVAPAIAPPPASPRAPEIIAESPAAPQVATPSFVLAEEERIRARAASGLRPPAAAVRSASGLGLPASAARAAFEVAIAAPVSAPAAEQPLSAPQAPPAGQAISGRAPPSALGVTAPLAGLPLSASLPFSPDAAPSLPVRSPPPSSKGNVDWKGGTARALDVPRGPALPFPAAAAGPPVQSKPNKLAQASFRHDLPRLGATPPAPTASAVSSAAHDAAADSSARVVDSANSGSGPSSASAPHSSPGSSVPAAPAWPAAATTAPVDSAPRKLTLEQHASLTAEIARSPSGAAAILGRYGVTLAEKEALDAHYGALVRADPVLWQAWQAEYYRPLPGT